ncbi:ABC transporter permease [Nocardioides limicola]|uniref:ABC transporter permease n=1 Tax=Nocardioides limicola TaxID=2803368 RepID=UPI00193C429B|nr:iron ABC transporter permease [Nocardioides sp. DJM-14]
MSATPELSAVPAATAPPSRRGRRAPLPHPILVLPAVLVALFALIPVAYLVIRAGDAGWARAFEILWRERTLDLVLRSLWLTFSVTFCCLVIGVGLAALVTRTDLPFRRSITVLAALPLAVPSYVAAYAWISTFSQSAGYWGALLVLTLCTYPYVFLPVAAVLRRTDTGLEEVARSLGRSGPRTFFTVTLRQARPAMAAGSLLVALYTLSDFGAVSLLRYDVFTRVIYTSYRASFDRTPAAVLALLLVVITVAITVAESRSRGRAEQARVGAGVNRPPTMATLSLRQRVAALAGVGVVAGLALGFPAVVLTGWLLRGQSAGIDVGRLVPAAGSTLYVSALGALVAVLMALPVGILAARSRHRLVRVTEHATYAGHALPGLVVALAMVFFGIRVVPGIYQQVPLLVITYAILFLPAAVGVVRASVALSSPRTEEMARSLGKSQLGVLRSVTIPLAAPGIGAGAALVMLTCMKELPATLLLRPTGMDTLATRLWTHTAVAEYAAAAPYAAVLVVLAVIPTLMLAREQIGLRPVRGPRAPRPEEAST